MSSLLTLSHQHTLSRFFFFFNDTATTEIYTLSLHDALPICQRPVVGPVVYDHHLEAPRRDALACERIQDQRKARARSEEHTSELQSPCISYAVFCLKKKKHKRLGIQLITLRDKRHYANVCL